MLVIRTLVTAVMVALAVSACAWGADGSGAASPCGITLSSNSISPNGDGFRDTLQIDATAPDETVLDLRVYDSAGRAVCTLARDFVLSTGGADFVWDGARVTRSVAPGKYTIRADFRGDKDVVCKETVVVEKLSKLNPVRDAVKPFFPIGVWFEGRPSWGGYPSSPVGAKAYYNRCFADLAAHGFNTVAVPNCPEELWDTLLQSAQKHKIKVVLEIIPLADLVTAEPVTEGQVHSAVKRVVDKIGKYDSLLRYQVRDEPAPNMVRNWLLVQRVLASVDPSRPAFSCFCSRDALQMVTSQAKLSEAVYDIYPLGTGVPPQSLGGFVGALDAFRAASGGYKQWPVLQSFAKPNAWRYPSPEELRCMTYLALAAGAKGAFYFIYQSLPHHPEKLEGLVDAEGAPTAIYDTASTLAGELAKLSTMLLGLQPGTTRYKIEGDARAGGFTGNDSGSVLIIASTRPDTAVTARVVAVPDGSWRDQLSGEEFRTTKGSLEVQLGPGCGRVLAKL